jgi:hypothetical protein
VKVLTYCGDSDLLASLNERSNTEEEEEEAKENDDSMTSGDYDPKAQAKHWISTLQHHNIDIDNKFLSELNSDDMLIPNEVLC